MRMNEQTKLMFAQEHLAHLSDLLKDNADGALITASLRDINMILDRQLDKLQFDRKDGRMTRKKPT
tara:strand:+ start:398 stop:595 length:198 start_codon:yes stop_codon:yes gene_type:complete